MDVANIQSYLREVSSKASGCTITVNAAIFSSNQPNL